MCPSVINNSTNKFTPRSPRSARNSSGGGRRGWAGLLVGGASQAGPIRTPEAEGRPRGGTGSAGCSCGQSPEPLDLGSVVPLSPSRCVRGTWWLKEIHTLLRTVPRPECVGRRSVLTQIYNFASLALSTLFATDGTAWPEVGTVVECLEPSTVDFRSSWGSELSLSPLLLSWAILPFLHSLSRSLSASGK